MYRLLQRMKPAAPRITWLFVMLWVIPVRANITVSTTTNGTQVDGYFNGTNSITIDVSLDNTGTSDFDTYSNGAIYLLIAWAESGIAPTTFNDFSEPGQATFGGNASTSLIVYNSHLTSTNTNPDQDNFDLKVVIIDRVVGATASDTVDITFESSQAYLKYDTSEPWPTLYSPGSQFNSMSVQYDLSEELTSGTITYIGTDGSDSGVQHTYTMTTGDLTEGSHTVDTENSTTNGNLVSGNYYQVSFNITDLAGNNRTATYSARYYDTDRPTITDITSSTANGLYGIGDNIAITVSFSEDVSTSGGNVVLNLNSGGTVSFTVSSASTGSATYTVADGETTNGSDLSVNSPVTVSGSVVDGAGNAMNDFSIPAGQNLDNSKSIVVDGVRPTISSITSASPSDYYSAGEQIDITVNFSEAVTLSSGNNLIITLETGSTDRTVSIPAADISNATSASGTYTVQDGDETSDLTALSVQVDGGSLTDAAGNAMNSFNIPSGQNIADAKDIVVETTAPTISQITSTSANGTYSIGDDINITVMFSEAVTLSGGNLVITLETGDTDQQVVITSINNATSASGTYTVQEGDQSTDLSVSNIALSSGTISDQAGNTLSDFTIPTAANLDDLKDIIVEATRPTIALITSTTGDGTYGIGSTINISVTFSEAVNLSTGSLIITLDNNQTVVVTDITNDVTVIGTYTVQEGDESSDLNVQDISVSGGSLTDNAGNSMSDFSIPDGQNLADSKDLVIDGVRPTISSISSTSSDGYYKIGDNVNTTVNFSEAVTLVGGNLVMELETGTTDQTVTITAISGATSASGTYTVQEGDASSDLTVNTIYLSGGNLQDAAGNTMSSFAIPTGSNLDDGHDLIIDGISPTDFTVGTVTTNGGTSVSGFWNSTNTEVLVTVPLEQSDASLVDGTIQLQAKIGSNSYQNIGAAADILQSDVNNGSKTITVSATGTGDTDFEEITGYTDGAVVSIRAVITDVAGNSTTGSASATALTIDEEAATITSISSTTPNGTYIIGESVEISLTFSEAVTLTSGSLLITLETGTTDRQVSISSISNATTATVNYTVQNGDESSDLSVKTITLSGGGTLIDGAGNPTSDFTIPAGSNLDDNKTIIIDGVPPAAFTVGAVTSTGGKVVSGYWNASNTAIKVTVPLASSDASLDGGTIQLEAEADGTFESLGSSTTILSDSLTAGSQTITVSATEAGATGFEQLVGFSDGDVVTIRAIITDNAGNSTTGAVSATAITVDQTAPDAFTVGTVTTTGGQVVSGYWNNSNSGVQVRVPLAADLSLVNGSIRLEAKAGSGGIWTRIGDQVTISDANVTAGFKDVTVDSGGTDSVDVRELPGFADDSRLYFRAILQDAAGNQTTGTQSTATLLIDETAPAITSITSTSNDGYYKIGDTVNVTVNFDEAVTLANGSVNVVLNVARTVTNTTVSNTNQVSFDYVVQENDETGQLSVNTVSVSGGDLLDVAGNVVSDFSIPVGSNLANNRTLIIDGIPPGDFTVDSINTAGGTVVEGYWNATNTGLEVQVPVANDASLTDGSIQLIANVDGGIFENLGGAVTIASGDLGGEKTISVTDTVFEAITGFADGVTISIAAIISDKAGNSTTGSASATTIVVDQTAPQVDTVGTVVTLGEPVNSGYWNGTNTGISVSVPLDPTDGTLSGGTVRLQAKAGATGSFENIAALETILDGHILAGVITVTADSGGTDSVDVREISGFADNKLLYFRAVVVDVAGNSTTYIQSGSTLLVDETRPAVSSVRSPNDDLAYNAGDTILVQVVVDEDVTVNGSPTIMMDVGDIGTPATFIGGSGTDTLVFRYVVGPNQSSDDLDYVSASPFQLNGAVIRDLAGNDFIPTLPTPGSDGSLSFNNDIVIDTEPPTATIVVSDTLVNHDDTPTVTVTFSERMTVSPQIYVLYAGGAIQDTTDMAQSDSVTWAYTLTIPDSNDGTATISIFGTDLAGNAVTEVDTTLKLDNTPPADFVTGSALPYGDPPVPVGWINSRTEQIQVMVNITSPTIDPSLYGGGKVDIQFFNLARGTAWVTIGEPDSITNGGNQPFLRTIEEIYTVLVPDTDLVVGDSLQVRAVITDKVGNRTFGDPSANLLVYDPNPLQRGTITGGNVLTSDTLISTDIITIEWSSFEEQDPVKESGLDHYEIAVEHIGDTTINTFVDWLDIGTNESHTFNLALEHLQRYRLHVRGVDRAGNISDTLASDTLLRLNSAPRIVTIDSTDLYEDLPFADSIRVVDPDVGTQLGDAFRYYVQTTRIVGQPAQDSVRVDSLTGRMTWTPTQDDTGSYSIRVIVRDNWGFADTLQFPLTVHAVNDTPVLVFQPPVDNISFKEDHTDTVRINLTPYAQDVDNDSTELSWQVVILDTTAKPGFPTGRVILGPGTPAPTARYLQHRFTRRSRLRKNVLTNKPERYALESGFLSPKITVTIDTVGGSTYATFDSDSNYYGENHRLIFFVSDPEGAIASDTIFLTILPENDPPVWSQIPLVEVLENDSVKIDFANYVIDVDDTLLTITVNALTNSSFMSITPANYTTTSFGDTVLFDPTDLWSDSALIQVIATDAAGAADSTTFVIDVIRVPRPQLAVAVLQNNAFTNFFEIVITDTVRKVVDVTLKVQNQVVPLDTVAEYTYVGHHDFVSPGTYTFDVYAQGVVGDTSITRQVGMTLAKTKASWRGASPDGKFVVRGSPGAVNYDQALLIVDSTMFGPLFSDRASYRLGNEIMDFRKAVAVSIQNLSEDLAIYQQVNGVNWEELPSMTIDGQVTAYTDRMGYFRLGPKTLVVPGETSLHQNYPNPFNPYTNIVFDVGFMEGPDQKIHVAIYNLLGQHVRTLVDEHKNIGRYTVRWNGKDSKGANVAAGIYFVRLTSNMGKVQTRKIMLLR
jgi:hypothetical protein